MALEMLRQMDQTYQPTVMPSIPAPASVPSLPSPLLSERIPLFLAQFKQKQRAAANVLDTTHTLRVFLDVVGDKPLSAVLPEDMDAFLAAIENRPVNASKKPEYKDLDVKGVLCITRRLHPPTLSLRTQEPHGTFVDSLCCEIRPAGAQALRTAIGWRILSIFRSSPTASRGG